MRLAKSFGATQPYSKVKSTPLAGVIEKHTLTQCMRLYEDRLEDAKVELDGMTLTGLHEGMSHGQRSVGKLRKQRHHYSQLGKEVSTQEQGRARMGTYNSSTQSSPLKPSPALTFSSQCAKCFAAGAHLALSVHSSVSAGRIYARRTYVTTRGLQHKNKA